MWFDKKKVVWICSIAWLYLARTVRFSSFIPVVETHAYLHFVSFVFILSSPRVFHFVLGDLWIVSGTGETAIA
jgi:hypothetical protein